MPTKVEVPPEFSRPLKRLGRKYPSVIAEVRTLIEELEGDERPGDKVPQVGYDVYKARLKNPSAGKGKSGGFRVIYYAQLADRVILLTIYSKTERINITAAEIKQLLEQIVPPEDDKS